MIDPQIELNKCAKKRKMSEKEAREEAKRIRNSQPGVNTLKVFECPICGMWHVGKLGKPTKKKLPKPPKESEYNIKIKARSGIKEKIKPKKSHTTGELNFV